MTLSFDQVLELTGFLLGLLYLWWEYHADTRLWLVSIVMPAISMWVYFGKGLYADFGIDIYYLLIAVYGYWHWTRRRAGGASAESKAATPPAPELPVTHAGARVLAVAACGLGLLWMAIYLVLAHLTPSTVPVCDAFTTALSIVAMWLLARKHVEQWLAWIVVDAVSVGLYCYKGIFFYATLKAVYIVVACFGFRKWLRMMERR